MMKYTKYVRQGDRNKLEYEVVSIDLKVHLTRIFDRLIEGEYKIIHQNKAINKSRNLLGLPLYVLTADDSGEFHPAEYAWHNGEFR